MYPKNATTPPEIDLGQMLLLADGTIQTSGASVRVKIGTGAWGAGAGTASCDATSGIWTYAPSQAETNAAYFIVALYKANCTALSKTVVTSVSDVAGYAGVDWSKVNAPNTSVNLSATTVKTLTDPVALTSGERSTLAGVLDLAIINQGDGADLITAIANHIAADWVAGDASPLAIVSALVANATFVQLVADAAAAKTAAQATQTEVVKIPRRNSAIAAGASYTRTNTSVTPNQSVTETLT